MRVIKPSRKNRDYFLTYLQSNNWRILKNHEYEDASVQIEFVKEDYGIIIFIERGNTGGVSNVRIRYYLHGAHLLTP